MTPHAGQRAQEPHWAGKPASILSILNEQDLHPVPAKVNSLTSSMEVASPDSIAIFIVDALTAKQLQIIGSSFANSFVRLTVNSSTKIFLKDVLCINQVLIET
mgnify:CR=1 FL=1|jgi:hypothetical protein